MELREEQKQAHDGIKRAFQKDNRAIVVQPTGTGKTYIALKLFEEYKDKKVLFVAPSKAILWELKNTIAKEYGVGPDEYKKIFPHLELTLYHGLHRDIRDKEGYIENFDADLVVYDEAHHIGDNKWGESIKSLMAQTKNTKHLGFTATPERTDGNDVTDTAFGGNIAYQMSLEEAVARDLLEMPYYITSIYSYSAILSDLEERVEEMKDMFPEQHDVLKKDLEEARNQLQMVKGLPEIFAQNMPKKDGKCLVFCKDIAHLKKMANQATEEGWFKGINGNVEMLQIHSEEPSETNNKILKRFREHHTATDGHFRVLFTVGMADEGVHIEGLDYEIMLRPTKSKRIFTQQLGRVMSIAEGPKVVVDIVNNIDSFDDIYKFADTVVKIKRQLHPELTEEEIREKIHISDETREIRGCVNKIYTATENNWEQCYERSVKWRSEHEGKGPRSNEEMGSYEKRIYDWEKSQIQNLLRRYHDVLETEIPDKAKRKIDKLKELGLKYEKKHRYTAEERFIVWKDWTIEHGITPSASSLDENEKKIAKSFGTAICRMKQNPEKYEEYIKEHDEILNKYGRGKDWQSAYAHFEKWKEWTLSHGRTPSRSAKNEEELRIANKMQEAWRRMRDKTEEYKDVLQEYEKIYNEYGIRKDSPLIKRFEKWKEWTIEHGIMPSRESQDKEERCLARNFEIIVLKAARANKEMYADILKEYEELYKQYGRRRNDKKPEEWFEIWKQWTIGHGVTPKRHSEDEEEKKIASGMEGALRAIKKAPQKYANILNEYEELYKLYGRREKSKGAEEWFELWKTWTITHGITPVTYSKNVEERKIATNMQRWLLEMRGQPDKYAGTLEEYDRIYAQYGRKKLKKLKAEKDGVLSEVQGLKTQAVAAQEENDRVSNMTQESSSPHLPGEYD